MEMFHGKYCLVLPAIMQYKNCGPSMALNIFNSIKSSLPIQTGTVQQRTQAGGRESAVFRDMDEVKLVFEILARDFKPDVEAKARGLHILNSIRKFFEKVKKCMIPIV